MSSATLAYPPRGRSRNVSAAAIAREASVMRQNAISALSRPQLGVPEKGAYARPDVRVEQPDSQHAVPDPRRPTPQQIIRPPPMTHAYSSPPTLPIPKQRTQPRPSPASPFQSQPLRSTPQQSPPVKSSARTRHPTRSPQNAVASSSQLTIPASTPPLVSDSSSSEDDQVLATRKRCLVRRQRMARAEAAFTSARDRSRKERIDALTARGIAEDAALERERLAREEAERKLRRTTVCRTPVVSRTYSTPPVKRASSGTDGDFTYAFPVSSSRAGMGLWNARAKHGTPRTRRALQELLEPTPNPQAVPFEDVRAAMEGELFPEHEPSPTRHSSPWTRARSRDSETAFAEDARRRAFAALMVAPSENASKPSKRRRPRDSDPVPQDRDCAACAAAWAHSLSSLEPSLGLNHLAVPTTPPLDTSDLSPASSTLSSPIATPRSWLPLTFFGRAKVRVPPTPPSPAQVLLPQPAPAEPVRHTCGRPQAQCFTAVDVNDTPLATPAPPPPPPRSTPFSSVVVATPAIEEAIEPVNKRASWLAPVNALFASAARVHEAYVQATLLTLSSPEHTTHRRRRRSSTTSSYYSRSLSPDGYFWPRGVGPADVRAFKADAPRAPAEPYVLRALDPIVRQPAPKHEILPQPEHERMGPAPAAFVSAAQAVGSGGPRARPVAHHAHLRASAILNARRIASGGPIPPGGIMLPERVVSIAWDVHASGAKRGSALKWGWRMIWSEDEE
ncbi:unnamed protein product [Peniophora sp. CBMAI 1063]|nr:unnamed protein product [Peniophora sp. CBMAI 1063]